ncbi:hypothetical protein AVEN_158302-1 [Araneus ventricosus]|uniref:Uncharacterized protein n=1 Tax=Araneus ventricosus TaxID=182803 RepID=A0A4Y2IER3_ARAVE|nr:hypothetical protein AVEN_158302-1 [Araneus ventricosus]
MAREKRNIHSHNIHARVVRKFGEVVPAQVSSSSSDGVSKLLVPTESTVPMRRMPDQFGEFSKSISPGRVETDALRNFQMGDSTPQESQTCSSMEALQPRDVADSVLYTLRTPVHVEVHDILLRPYNQPS